MSNVTNWYIVSNIDDDNMKFVSFVNVYAEKELYNTSRVVSRQKLLDDQPNVWLNMEVDL